MAFDPTKIGAQYKYTEFLFTNSTINVNIQIVPFNPYRVALLFSCLSASWVIRPNAGPTDVSHGFRVIADSSQWTFKMNETGPLCQQQWFGQPTNAANGLYVLSVEWIPEAQ